MTATHNLVLLSRASDRGAYAELRQLLSSQIQVISPSIDQIMDFIVKLRKVDGSEVEIEVALREALANAIVHGNREDSCKHVCVRCRCTTGGDVSITVQDQGTVLKPTKYPTRQRQGICSARRGAGSI